MLLAGPFVVIGSNHLSLPIDWSLTQREERPRDSCRVSAGRAGEFVANYDEGAFRVLFFPFHITNSIPKQLAHSTPHTSANGTEHLVRLQCSAVNVKLDCSAAKRSFIEISSPINDDDCASIIGYWQSADFSRQDYSWSTGAGECRISSRTSTATFMVSSKFFLPRKFMRDRVTR